MEQDLYINPGIRCAYNLRSGLQIVPGIGILVGIVTERRKERFDSVSEFRASISLRALTGKRIFLSLPVTRSQRLRFTLVDRKD